MKRDFQPDRHYVSGDPGNKGYKFAEATQFIEFCVDLDSQDDRLPSSKSANHDPMNPNYWPQIDPMLWDSVYDSRTEVAKDVIAFKATKASKKDHGWAKLYQDIIDRASKAPPSAWTVETLSKDPRYNGFGSYQSAWRLYKGLNENAGTYAIAIRGTVFSAKPSVVEDVVFHPVVAKQFLNRYVSFASFNGASLHSGFAHATFSLLLDDRYGIIRALNDMHVPANTRLYIVGHSQGAAMATLTHAFLHYAMKDATKSNDIFTLYGKNYKLKSYVYAQPKPGNFEFAADFASITQSFDNAIVINNDIDPVPQVPLTMQDMGDLDHDLPGTSLIVRIFHYISGVGSGFRGAVGRIAEPIVRKSDAGYGYYYNYPHLVPGKDTVASSWNFMAAGHLILVYGTPGDPSDEFLQHHASTYRDLIKAQIQE